VDEESDPDLFWALRGGGGNFGVATRFKFRLQPVNEILGGIMVLPAEPSVIAGFIAEAEAAPEELSTIVNVMTAPPMPFLPPELHGRPIVLAFIAYAGPPEEGERAVAPLRALATPLADLVRPLTYPELYSFEPEAPEGFHPVYTARTQFAESVDESGAAAIVEALGASTAMTAVTQLRVVGGAMARVPADATAFAHRAVKLMVNVVALHVDPGERAQHREWVSELSSKLLQENDGAYVGFLSDEGPDRVRAAYPGATWDRLTQVKAEYDPDNLFRSNQNIPPA
jgi:FAD/FMN-containing dehydrogenase